MRPLVCTLLLCVSGWAFNADHRILIYWRISFIFFWLSVLAVLYTFSTCAMWVLEWFWRSWILRWQVSQMFLRRSVSWQELLLRKGLVEMRMRWESASACARWTWNLTDLLIVCRVLMQCSSASLSFTTVFLLMQWSPPQSHAYYYSSDILLVSDL